MGDRFDHLKPRHANVESLLRRPGIGHNNGPTLDMSWEAWVWRRAQAEAWATPGLEIVKMRVRRAERLGITYPELTAALMNTGSNLGAAVMPLSLAARVMTRVISRVGGRPGREVTVETRPAVANRVAKFGGRLFLLADSAAVPALAEAEQAGLLATLNQAVGGKIEAVGWGHDGPAIRAMLKHRGVPHQEVFLIGSGVAHQLLGERAGLPFTKDIERWFT
jgi:hypothetical protein